MEKNKSKNSWSKERSNRRPNWNEKAGW